MKPHRLDRSALLAVSLWVAACAGEPGAKPEGSPAPGAEMPAPRFSDPSAGPGAMAPQLAKGRDGVLLTWLEPTAGGHALYLSNLRGEGWTEPLRIAAGEGFFANWADLPGVVESSDGSRHAHWLRKLGEDTYAYGVALARSEAAEEPWQEAGLLHNDTSPSEHGFVSYSALPDGGVQAFWLDGRAMLEGGAMQLRTARLGGKEETVLDDRVCECCATDAALAASGPVVAYRDRGPSEVRDIAVVRATGDGWSEPTLIHDDGWRIHGCPVNGPAIDAAGERLAVAWFTAAGDEAKVRVAFSGDGGRTFEEPIVVDGAAPLGRVDIALDGEGNALVSWLGTTTEGAEIRWRRVSPEGEGGAVQVVSTTTAERSAGVPRMVRYGEELVFAWVEDTAPSRLRTGLVALR